uniref:Uncharacterized protein n=1 Tax=viral metagenome TaxID=1070528 RepID=A0A6C0AF90_9ZZZZ
MLQVISSSPKLFSVNNIINVTGAGFQPFPLQSDTPQNISYAQVCLQSASYLINLSSSRRLINTDKNISVDLRDTELKNMDIKDLIGMKFNVLVKVSIIRFPDVYFVQGDFPGQGKLPMEDENLIAACKSGDYNSCNNLTKKYTISELWSPVNSLATYTFDKLYEMQITNSSPKLYSSGKLITIYGSGFSQDLQQYNAKVGLQNQNNPKDIISFSLQDKFINDNEIIIDLSLINPEFDLSSRKGQTYNIFIEISQWGQRFTSDNATYVID